MPDPTTLLVILAVVAAAFIILMGVIGVFILVNSVQTNTRIEDLKTLVAKTSAIEEAVAALADYQLGVEDSSQVSMFMSKDGKYSANTPEELFQKMAEGGDLNISVEEQQRLIDFFKSTTDSINEMSEDDDEEDWKK